MQRQITKNLIDWKNKPNRKPLILNGARQTGKTWILKDFGNTCFSSCAYIRFDNNEVARNIFNQDYNISRIVEQLSLISNVKIKPKETLIVFDEIQECPKALTSLKYFCEEAPEYYVACAGSLLGIKLAADQKKTNAGTGFPVGKVEYLNLMPMTFIEFLLAIGMQRFVPYLENHDWQTLRVFGEELRYALKKYFIVGGMPEVVLTYVQTEDYKEVRDVQKRILRDYDNDISKHAPKEDIPKIKAIWDSVPTQLAKENKRFVYSEVGNGGSKALDNALWWLYDAGLLHKVKRVTTPKLPLASYLDGAFKLFFLDIGLLGAKSELSPTIILEQNSIFTEFKGSLAEQFVNQELRTLNNVESQYYWTGRNSEIDFLIQVENNIIPIEVKAQTNLQSKSLRYFCEKYSIEHAIRYSLSDYNTGEYPFGTKITDIPLFCICVD